MLRWILLLILPSILLAQSILTPPKNMTGIIGQDISFMCNVEFGSIKTLSFAFDEKPVYTYQYGLEDFILGDDKYEVIQDGRNFSITAKKLDNNDGGLVTCTVDTIKKTAVLIVLDTPRIQPLTEIPFKTKKMTYACEGAFGAPNKHMMSPNQYPQLQMFIENAETDETILFEPGSQGNYHKLIQVVEIPLEIEMNGTTLTCEIWTDSPHLVVRISETIIIDAEHFNAFKATTNGLHPTAGTVEFTSPAEEYPKFPLEVTSPALLAIIGLSLLGISLLALCVYYRKKSGTSSSPDSSNRTSLIQHPYNIREESQIGTPKEDPIGLCKSFQEAKFTSISETQPRNLVHGTFIGLKNDHSNMDEKIGLNIINEIRLDCEYATIPNVKENPAQALPEGSIKEAFCRSPTLRLLSDHLRSTKDDNSHIEPPLSPDHILSTREVKMSKMFNELYKSVIKNCEQLLEEGEEYSNQLTKVYLARGMIATVEKALEDWLLRSG